MRQHWIYLFNLSGGEKERTQVKLIQLLSFCFLSIAGNNHVILAFMKNEVESGLMFDLATSNINSYFLSSPFIYSLCSLIHDRHKPQAPSNKL